MRFARFSFGIIFLALDVTSWTVDLEEARKFLFLKNDRLEKLQGVNRDYEAKDQVLFSNRFDSNSKHHDTPSESYAHGYGYESYVENKGPIHDGGVYLEGLKRSLETFSRRLMNCRAVTMNETVPLPAFNSTDLGFNSSGFNSTGFNLNGFNSTAWRPALELAYNATAYNTTECREASEASEHVRRLSELAIKAVEELKDLAYSRKHMKDDPRELDKQENEYILKLAWFLDRLARYTGYRPKPSLYKDDEDDVPTSTTTPTLPPPPRPTFAPELVQRLITCLKQKSDVPVEVRCALPATNLPIGDQPSPSNRREAIIRPEQTQRATSEQELLIATEERPYYPYYDSRVKKRSIPETEVKSLNNKTKMADEAKTVDAGKSSRADQVILNKKGKMAADKTAKSLEAGRINMADDPTLTLVKYFVKHKIWESDNRNYDRSGDFDVSNSLHKITKRDAKKLRLPEDPYQELGKYVKNKKGVHFVKDENQAKKLKQFIEKIRDTKSKTPKAHLVRISKLFRSKRFVQRRNDFEQSDFEQSETKRIRSKRFQTDVEQSHSKQNDNKQTKRIRSKRSYEFEKDIDKPKISENLFQDLSYYVKNKKTTNLNRDFVQAAQVRAGLQQIFLVPNIETVRRFGSNYNPAVPDPLLDGAVRTVIDN